jgi:hypothetical protein
MRLALAGILVCIVGASSAYADDSTRRAEVAAANADAQEALRQEILATEIEPGLTVDPLLAKSGGAVVLQPAVASAEQIGGTRWIDDQTCQLRLDVDGKIVRELLLEAAAEHPDGVPLSIERLKARLGGWSARAFSGTGTSTALAAAEQLRPDDQQSTWAAVSDADRRAAIAAARRNAAERVLDSIRPITMPDGKSLGDALEQPGVVPVITGFLASQPITAVEFRDDLEVRLTIALDPDSLWQVIRSALPKQNIVELPAGNEGWKRLREQVERRVAIPIGRSIVTSSSTVPAPVVVAVPEHAPSWVEQSIDAEGLARSNGPLLKTARVAEAVADERLAAKISDLPLRPGLTIGQASHQDPRFAEAVSRALGRARAFKVDYDYPERGGVRVKVGLDLADLWRELVNR